MRVTRKCPKRKDFLKGLKTPQNLPILGSSNNQEITSQPKRGVYKSELRKWIYKAGPSLKGKF